MADFEAMKLEMQAALAATVAAESDRINRLCASVQADYDALNVDYVDCKNKILDDISGVKKMKYEWITYEISNMKCSICVVAAWNLKEKYEDYHKLEDMSKVLNILKITKRRCPDETMTLESKLKIVNSVDILEWRVMYKYNV
jgi:hypothetical protein